MKHTTQLEQHGTDNLSQTGWLLPKALDSARIGDDYCPTEQATAWDTAFICGKASAQHKAYVHGIARASEHAITIGVARASDYATYNPYC